MFSITKLSTDSQQFVSELSTSMKSRSKEASLAIARVLSDKALMPSSPVEDIVTFYRTNCQLDMEAKVSEINELMVIDTKQVLDYCQKFFMLRYSFMAPKDAIFAFNSETAVEDFFGISRQFDRETIDCLKKCPQDMMRYITRFSSIHNELYAASAQAAA